MQPETIQDATRESNRGRRLNVYKSWLKTIASGPGLGKHIRQREAEHTELILQAEGRLKGSGRSPSGGGSPGPNSLPPNACSWHVARAWLCKTRHRHMLQQRAATEHADNAATQSGTKSDRRSLRLMSTSPTRHYASRDDGVRRASPTATHQGGLMAGVFVIKNPPVRSCTTCQKNGS